MKRATTSRRKKRARTFSLSQDVIEVLENYRRRKQVESLTAAVESIIREWKKADLAAQATAYYDSLTDDEMKRDKHWGEFSEHQI
jgi:transcriptional regulator of met regulon